MNEKVAGDVRAFVEAVNTFFSQVETWISSTNLKGSRQEIEITEESSGPYQVEKLMFFDEAGRKIAELIPVGTFIIGGNGRVDFNGTIDKAILLNLEVDGPSITSTITAGGQSNTSKTSFFKGIDKQGWYWIEDKRRGKANFITKDLFAELLMEVSDYELA